MTSFYDANEAEQKTFVAQFWTELDGWVDSDIESHNEEEIGFFVYEMCEKAQGDVWRYYNRTEA